MRKIEVSENAVALRLEAGELPPDRAGLLQLVRRALAEAGVEPWPSVTAECFAAGTEALVLARPGPSRLQGIYFEDFERLLRAAAAVKTGESALYEVGRGYMLVLPPGKLHPALYEYGEERFVHPDWLCHAREQGACLLEREAIHRLARVFSAARA